MKGIIIAGGLGTRLMPLTKITNKHLLPVYNLPIIMHPLNTLKNAGITKIMIITSPESAGDFIKFLGSGKELGVELTYKLQDGVGGIAQALSLAEDFAKGDNVMVHLGDNVVIGGNFTEYVKNFKGGGHVFLTEVKDPERSGVAELKDGRIIGIEEKPEKPKSNKIITGIYIYDNHVFDAIRTLKPSARGELEITDVSKFYLDRGSLEWSDLPGEWHDCGTPDSLYEASTAVKKAIEDGRIK